MFLPTWWLFAIALIATTITFAVLRKRNREEQAAEVEQWRKEREKLAEKLPLILQGDEEATSWFQEVYEPWLRWGKTPEFLDGFDNYMIRDLYQKAIQAIADREAYSKQEGYIRAKLTEVQALRQGGEILERITTLAGMVKTLQCQSSGTCQIFADKDKIVTSDLKSELSALALQWYAKLSEKRHTKSGFLRLKKYRGWISVVTRDINFPGGGFRLPPYPDDWDDLVAKFIENPALCDFQRTSDLPAGEAGLRAAAALRNKDLTEAKFIMALYSGRRIQSGAVTDEQATRLFEFIEAGNARLVEKEALDAS